MGSNQCRVQPVCPIIQLFWYEVGTEIRTHGEHDNGFDQWIQALAIRSIMGATLKRREGSEREVLVFAWVTAFSKFISTDLLYSGFCPFSLFL